MKTIKQIADELGVSKTAVMKKIEKLDLRSSLNKNANQFVLDKKQERLVKSTFANTKEREQKQTFATTENRLLSILQEELENKNRQIATLQEQNAKLLASLESTTAQLTTALENTTASLQAAQLLHAGTMKQIEAPAKPEQIETPAEPAIKKGLFSKLFGK